MRKISLIEQIINKKKLPPKKKLKERGNKNSSKIAGVTTRASEVCKLRPIIIYGFKMRLLMVRQNNHPLATIYPHIDVACDLQVDDVPLVEFTLLHEQ